MMRTVLVVAIVALLPVALVYAQAPAPAQASTPAQAEGSAPAPAPSPAPAEADQGRPDTVPAPLPPPDNYTYDPAGRRDPFLNLLNTGAEPRSASGPEGAASLMVAEVSVRGILESRGAHIAMIKGPDNKTYLVHPGDRLLDGTIKSITPQGLVILQQVNDPLSLVKEREVRKMLREDGKG
jgi:type IV pilus assembly protein PilP